jgi:deazaflavin-dependent oxidoreductase (nitroreductase family)
MNPLDKRLMRWSNGKLNTGVGTDFRDNGVLLRCTGAKSGKPRDIPLLATPFDGGWVLIASATGVEKNPARYHNLKAHHAAAWLSLAVARSHALRTKQKAQSASGRGKPRTVSTPVTPCIRGVPTAGSR